MKKFYILNFLFIFFILSILFSCNRRVDNQDKDIIKNEGWYDENTYRMAAVGKPIISIKNQEERKKSAKRAAIMNAHFKILKKFKSFSKNVAANKNNNKSKSIQIKKIIKDGKVIVANYDDEDNCEIIYQIQSKHLKKQIEESDLSGVEIIN